MTAVTFQGIEKGGKRNSKAEAGMTYATDKAPNLVRSPPVDITPKGNPGCQTSVTVIL